jgi:hypothetical protein
MAAGDFATRGQETVFTRFIQVLRRERIALGHFVISALRKNL